MPAAKTIHIDAFHAVACTDADLVRKGNGMEEGCGDE